MTTSRKATPKRKVSRADGVVVDESWRSRITQPRVTDPERRRDVIDRATSLIKTHARIDTITAGRD